MGAIDHEVIAALLLAMLVFVLTVALLLVVFAIQWQRRTALALSENLPLATTPEFRPVSTKHFPFALKQPDRWLAIKCADVRKVQSALALHNPQPCSWVEALAETGGQMLFVAPPVSGWVLVIGTVLPDPADDVDACFRFLAELSRKLGKVQLFSVNTMLDHHAWAWFESGTVRRAYAWAGETLWNQGEITRAEFNLGIRCRDYGERTVAFSLNSDGPPSNNSDKVHLLAARWSVDPGGMDERFMEREWGIAGEASRLF